MTPFFLDHDHLLLTIDFVTEIVARANSKSPIQKIETIVAKVKPIME